LFKSVFQLAPLSAFVAALVVLGLALWWLVLVRRRKVWFPLMRRLEIPPKVTPRVRLEPPPLVPFLCFLVAAVAAGLLAFQPGKVEPQSNKRTSIDSHLLIDLSPSMSRTSLPELLEKTVVAWEALAKDGKVTVGTTHGAETSVPNSRDEVAQLVSKAGFSRAGVRLAAILQKQLAGLEKVDRIVLLSDDDAHSWAGLRSGFFRDRAVLTRVAAVEPSAVSNLFIESVRRTSGFSAGSGILLEADPGSGREVWEVEILRRRREDLVGLVVRMPESSGTIEVLSGEKVVGRGTWAFPAGGYRVVVSIEIESPGEILHFRIDSDGSERPDAIKLDNEFRTRREAGPGSVILISEPRGEGILQDDSWQLATVLGILGYDVRRFDSASAAFTSGVKAARWIVQSSGTGHLENVCPASLSRHLSAVESIWLAPRGAVENVSWNDLCTCYSRLSGTSNPERFCGEVNTRQAWLGLLPSLGAKQVGGRLGDSTGSFAWRGKAMASIATGKSSDATNSSQSGSDMAAGSILAFTLPLEPSVATGIDHARFPLLLKNLLEVERGTSRELVANWPRIPDSADAGVDPRDLPLSNVPTAESLLQSAAASDLPPLFHAPGSGVEGSQMAEASTNHEQINPWPWVRGLAAAAGGAVAVEAVWHGGKWLAIRGLPHIFGLILTFLLAASAAMTGAITGAAPAQAAVELIFAGSGSASRFTRLSREVSTRTSITVMPSPQAWSPSALAGSGLTSSGEKPSGIDQPWLWSNGLKPLLATGSNSGKLFPAAGRWLRRGGFLVVEGVSSKEILDAAFKQEFPSERWAPVPTDHELMRSFYLLDALPACAPEIWHQFTFDGRVAAVAIPQRLSEMLRDGAPADAFRCPGEAKAGSPEKGYRAFINLLMVALTTDYKKDQVHLPEILKRLR
jgi:hypothetical protein